MTEKWTLTRNFADNTCTHNIEQFLAGRKADELVLTGQDCDYEPPCVREAKEFGTFNNGNSGKHKELNYVEIHQIKLITDYQGMSRFMLCHSFPLSLYFDRKSKFSPMAYVIFGSWEKKAN